MPMFRKKPVVIEAVQYHGPEDAYALGQFTGTPGALWWDAQNVLHVRTLEGEHIASPGDWIIRGVKGEFYPCKPDIFERTYEPVPNGPSPLTTPTVAAGCSSPASCAESVRGRSPRRAPTRRGWSRRRDEPRRRGGATSRPRCTSVITSASPTQSPPSAPPSRPTTGARGARTPLGARAKEEVRDERTYAGMRLGRGTRVLHDHGAWLCGSGVMYGREDERYCRAHCARWHRSMPAAAALGVRADCPERRLAVVAASPGDGGEETTR
jgi:hypothetical protein